MSKRPPVSAFKKVIEYCREQTDCTKCPLQYLNEFTVGCQAIPDLWKIKPSYMKGENEE